MGRRIYWNVDTGNDFMRNDADYKGSMYVEGVETIRGTLEKITKKARMLGIQIINSGDCHDEDSKELSHTPDFKNTWPHHSLRNSYGAKFIPETKPHNPLIIDWKAESINLNKIINHIGDIVILKDDVDVFNHPHTDNVLRSLYFTDVTLYGVITNVCVDLAIVGLVERGYNVKVIENGIKELPGTDKYKFYNKWQAMGVKLVTFYG